MGYFSNGTEGNSYEDKWCIRCIHNKGCSVWAAHLLYNYDQCRENGKDLKEILNLFIPQSKDGLSNNICTMFRALPGKTEPDDGEPLLFERHEIGGKPLELKETA